MSEPDKAAVHAVAAVATAILGILDRDAPCSCIPAYKHRGLTDPQCTFCDVLGSEVDMAYAVLATPVVADAFRDAETLAKVKAILDGRDDQWVSRPVDLAGKLTETRKDQSSMTLEHARLGHSPDEILERARFGAGSTDKMDYRYLMATRDDRSTCGARHHKAECVLPPGHYGAHEGNGYDDYGPKYARWGTAIADLLAGES